MRRIEFMEEKSFIKFIYKLKLNKEILEEYEKEMDKLILRLNPSFIPQLISMVAHYLLTKELVEKYSKKGITFISFDERRKEFCFSISVDKKLLTKPSIPDEITKKLANYISFILNFESLEKIRRTCEDLSIEYQKTLLMYGYLP